MNKYRFSVWTATYNRDKLLKRVYQSLLNQTFKDFEWIIIDDGSVDKTEEVVKEFINEGILKCIRYYKKENGGKHTAWKMVTDKFTADYVITIDSDDTLTPDALELFNKYWMDLEKSNEYNDFWEVKGRVQDENGRMVGSSLPESVFDTYTQEMTYRYKIKSEMQACRKTSVLRAEAKVPDNFIFERFCNNLPESIRWMRAGKYYKTRYFDEVVRTYYSDAEITFSQSNRKTVNSKGRYNYLVGLIYAIEEHRDMILKWDKFGYLKLLVALLYISFALKKNPFTVSPYKLNKLDIIIMYFGYLPVYFLFLIRG